MLYYNKRTILTIEVISFILLLCGTMLMAFSGRLIPYMYGILQDKIFHRTFLIERWRPTIVAFFSFPVFFVILANALLFPKFTDRDKTITLAYGGIILAAFMFFCFVNGGAASMDSDMAAEMVLAKECVREKTFWPLSWYYSTEIRLINSQILTAPFFFLKDWNLIKALSAFSCNIVLFLSMWFLLWALDIKKRWIKILCSLFIVSPWSISMWQFVHYGSYYNAHIEFSYVYIALFIKTIKTENTGDRHFKIWRLLFLLTSFISGVTTMRYLLIYIIPLMIAVLFPNVLSQFVKDQTAEKEFSFKKYFINNRLVFFSICGFFLGCVGYFVNTTILAKIFKYSFWYAEPFWPLGKITLLRLYQDIFHLSGYVDGMAVMTPAGINNIMVFVAAAAFIIASFSFARDSDKCETSSLYVKFVLCSIIFTGFLYINVEYMSRYFIMEAALIVPCFAIYLEHQKTSPLTKYILGVSLSVLIIGNAFINCESRLSTHAEQEKRAAVMQWLLDNGYSFGFASIDNANPITYFTNGKIEVARVDTNEDYTPARLVDSFSAKKWLTCKRYYDEDYKKDEKCFFLVSQDEFNNALPSNVFKNGSLSYNDDYYRIYTYNSPAEFKSSF